MPHLLELPNETLLNIINNVTPDDIVNFAMCCNQINMLAEDYLAVHRERMEIYQHITLWGCWRHQDEKHPLELLRDICLDWRVAYYSRTLIVDCCQADPKVEAWQNWGSKWDKKWIPKEMEAVENLLDGIEDQVRERLQVAFQWDEAEVKKGFDRTTEGYRGVIVGLLILSLPNIWTIYFNDYCWGDDFVLESLRKALQPNNREARLLTKLTEVTVSPGTDRCERHESFCDICCSLQPFLWLPSMRSIRPTMVRHQDYLEHRCKWNSNLSASPVTEIDIYTSSISAETFIEMFKPFKALKRFSYEYEMRIYDRDGAEDFVEIMRWVFQHASSTLEYLAISGYRWFSTSIANMRKFEVLKEVRLPAHVFLGVVEEDSWLDSETEYSEDEEDEEDEKNDEPLEFSTALEQMKANADKDPSDTTGVEHPVDTNDDAPSAFGTDVEHLKDKEGEAISEVSTAFKHPWADVDTASLHSDTEGSCTEGDLIPLADFMPASIETIRLDGSVSMEMIEALLKTMPEHRAERFPNLKKIHFSDAYIRNKEQADAWIGLYRDLGVELVLTDVRDLPERAYIPPKRFLRWTDI